MGAELYATDPAYRAAFDECAALAGPVGGGSLVDSVFGRPMDESDGYDDLEATNLVLLAQGYALAQCLLARGLRPAALAGYSLGEFTAAVVAARWTWAKPSACCGRTPGM
nr:acyltransferase domain-containing protein [Methylomagnum ishizawai]